VIRYLSVRGVASRTEAAGHLLERAIDYVESKKADYVRATTPAIQPYVEVYVKHGFRPLRRDFRISWQLDDIPETSRARPQTEVSDRMIGIASDVFVRSSSPYWDWHTKEEGGPATVARTFKDDKTRGARWIIATKDGEPVGVTGIIPDYYGTSRAWFRGAFVLPEYRGGGIGSALMAIISKFAKSLGQRQMTVYTFSYLDSLAPGALLYLKTGGKIEAEYLQLSKPLSSSLEK